MKFLNASLLFVVAASLLTACGSNDKKEERKEPETKMETSAENSGPATRLEGAWEIKRAEGSMKSVNLGTVYEFTGNELSFEKDGFKNPGKTEITDSTFSFQAEGNEYKFMYNYKFNGDTLVVEMQKSSGQVFYMVKK